MKIVIAPDSFKGSMSALQVGQTMEKAVLEIFPECQSIVKPMADGGEGTLDILLQATNGRKIPITCMGPDGKEISTSYGIQSDQKTAIIECANIAGLPLVPLEMRNPDKTTSYGIGEAIRDALDRGCSSIVIGLGGSAVNDGGFGMLQALGLKAWDEKGNLLSHFGKDMLRVAKVNIDNLDKRIWQTEIKIASDVTNPLCGETGASRVFGPQKGATPAQVTQYDQALDTYGTLLEKEFALLVKNKHRTKTARGLEDDVSKKSKQGAGAAGGIGFALLTIGGNIYSGAKLIADMIELESAIKKADLVLTGEGKSDEQTLYGKAPGFIAEIANKHNVPTVLISGSLGGETSALQKKFSGCYSIQKQPITLKDSIKNAESLLYEQTKQILHFWKQMRKIY